VAALAIQVGEIGAELGECFIERERALVERDRLGKAFLLLEGLGEVDERVEEDRLPLERLAEAGFGALEVPGLAIGDAERVQVIEVVAIRLVCALRSIEGKVVLAGLEISPGERIPVAVVARQ